MNDIDPNKIIAAPDTCCQGTCKTNVGCTCGTDDQPPKAAPGNQCNPLLRGDRCCAGRHKLEVYNWMESMPAMVDNDKMVEVQFKSTRKGYYINSADIDINKGDVVAVEATPGHDIGEVTLTGKLVVLQMKKNNYRSEIKRVYRIAKPNDIEKYEEAKKKEHKTMLRAREMAEELGLAMKISDVEYQGDGNKVIFYYIADERVDFRQLIKMYASEFRVKIEMKQIGARQEAGRVGGIGPCGRELCCSSSMSNFVSVSTSAARLQDIPLNPQKLAGQCGKLKCCLNFEVDVYVEAQRKLPSREIPLETKDSIYYHFKTDILSGMMTYSSDRHFAANLISLPKDRVHEVMRMNKEGSKPQILHTVEEVVNDSDSEAKAGKDILEDSINRFDGNNKLNNKGRRSSNRGRNDRNDRNDNAPDRRRVPHSSNNGRDNGETNDGQAKAGKTIRPVEANKDNNPNRINSRRDNNRNKLGGKQLGGGNAGLKAKATRADGDAPKRDSRPNRNRRRPPSGNENNAAKGE